MRYCYKVDLCLALVAGHSIVFKVVFWDLSCFRKMLCDLVKLVRLQPVLLDPLYDPNLVLQTFLAHLAEASRQLEFKCISFIWKRLHQVVVEACVHLGQLLKKVISKAFFDRGKFAKLKLFFDAMFLGHVKLQAQNLAKLGPTRLYRYFLICGSLDNRCSLDAFLFTQLRRILLELSLREVRQRSLVHS